MIEKTEKIGRVYLTSVLMLMLILPVLSIVVALLLKTGLSFIELTGKWFLFWGIGVRLLTAGLRQVWKPSFTATEIFHLTGTGSYVIVKELGFANICQGLLAVMSLFMPEIRVAAAITCGLYFGIAGVHHMVKRPASPNEWLALISDMFILLVMAVYCAGKLS